MLCLKDEIICLCVKEIDTMLPCHKIEKLKIKANPPVQITHRKKKLVILTNT